MISSQQPNPVRVLEVGTERAGQRLDNFLFGHLPGVPRSLVYRIIRTGQVRVNGRRAKPLQKLQIGDRVRVPPVRLRKSGSVTVPSPSVERLESAVLYENDQLLVCDKPPGMAVHGGSGVLWGVVDAFRQARSGCEIGLVHRLDRDTSGLLLLAKNPESLRFLQAQFRRRETLKRYFALLDGRLPEDRLVVDQPLLKTQRSGERFMRVDAAGKPAITEFVRLEDHPGASFVEALPVTGRTHQIRAHALHLGTPCAGDPRYSTQASQARWRDRGLRRLFLHAHALEFTGPDGERMQVSSPLPDDLREVLDRL